MEKKRYLRLIDMNTDGTRYDVTPIFADHEAFSSLVDDFIARFEGADVDFVASIDALGFILGTAVAMKMKKGFITIRKGGKLPVKVDKVEFVDYTGQTKSLELRRQAIKPGTKILVVDEWIETGTQIRGAIELIEKQGGVVVGIATISMDENEETLYLTENYNCQFFGLNL